MFSYFSLVNEAFDMALSGLIVIGGASSCCGVAVYPQEIPQLHRRP